MVEGVFRLQNTAYFRVDIGRGYKVVPLKQFGKEDILDAPRPIINEDVRVRALGWQKEGTTPLWKIEQSAPLPFTLLSVATQIKVND